MGEHEQVSTNSDAATLEVAQREIQKIGPEPTALAASRADAESLLGRPMKFFGESAELLTIQRDRKTEVADKTLGAMAEAGRLS